ncbi:MAG TPA: hypothetical protein VG246_10305 [Acidimicrobiales bacterium]|nr:hypothetical protein [Acidimicrobiales bacterium]
MNAIKLRALSRHVVHHPGDAHPLLVALWRMRATQWWRRAPFLPLPDRSYWRFRLATATGSPTGSPDVREMVEFAQWSGRQRVGR